MDCIEFGTPPHRIWIIAPVHTEGIKGALELRGHKHVCKPISEMGDVDNVWDDARRRAKEDEVPGAWVVFRDNRPLLASWDRDAADRAMETIRFAWPDWLLSIEQVFAPE